MLLCQTIALFTARRTHFECSEYFLCLLDIDAIKPQTQPFS